MPAIASNRAPQPEHARALASLQGDAAVSDGHLRRVAPLGLSHRLRRNSYTWPLHDRVRVDQIRADALAALFGHHRPDAVTAAVIALRHRTGSLGAVLNLTDDGARHAAQSAEPIASGRWADGSNTGEVNLAVTAAVVLPALV